MLRLIKRSVKAWLSKKYFCKKSNAHVKGPFVNKGTQIGNHVRIDWNVHVGSNVSIGDFSYINDGGWGAVAIENGTKIGKFCSIAPNVYIGLGNHPVNLLTTHPLLYEKVWLDIIGASLNDVPKVAKPGDSSNIVIGNDVWIGSGVIIKNNIKIGDGAIIASGSVVTHDVPPYHIVGGIPARIIRKRFSDEQINKITKCEEKWWDWSPEKINENLEVFYNIEEFIHKHC
jgi:acetyltransferase-like isoleucine patch superfamily enzyme